MVTADPRGDRVTRALLLLAVVVFLALASDIGMSFDQGPNNRNVSVDTRVNVTGSAPEILQITIPTTYTLNAGSLTHVICNVSIRDYNGWADISRVNATLHRSNMSVFSGVDNNTVYLNQSCANVTGQSSGAFTNYTCSFYVTYYASNGSWNCTVFVNDSINLRANGTNSTFVNALLALNVTPLIDYGDMAMGDTSGDIEANVTNLGNVPINVSVRGYGAALDDGLSFTCDQGTLSVDLQHFAANATAAYADKQALAASYARIAQLSIPKALNYTRSLNTTYWQLYLNPAQNVFGHCNGTIIFQAEST